MSDLFGHTRTRVTSSHTIVAPDSHVASPLVGWDNTEGVVLISPAMASGGPRFVQYLVQGGAGCQTTGAAPGVERLVYVLAGEATLDGEAHGPHAAFWLPPGEPHHLQAPPGVELLVFERRYEALPGVATPDRVTTTLADAPSEPFLGDPDAVLATLLPITPAFDMAVNVFTFQPGAALPLVESHVMEHGLYMAAGQGVYRLDEHWYPVRAGDTIWMASYCPQWFVAMGKQPAVYIYYKDIHRDPLTTAPSPP